MIGGVETLRTDPLTGLRILPLTSLGALRRDASLAVVDLVHFRDRVNATVGYPAGDRVIAAVGQRLSEGLAPWHVFRSAGDGFTIEVPPPVDRASAERLARRVATILAVPFEETGAGLEATVGISLRTVGDDALTVWLEAERGADVEAPLRGRAFHIAGDPV
jgi:GGDEF domain-containing protein